MTATWILVANASEARLFKTKNTYKIDLELLNHFDHPESRMKNIDLTSDRPGHYESRGGTGRGSYTEHTEPKTVESEHFALQLANEIDSGRVSNSFQKLLVVAPGHFQGLLKKHLNHHLNNIVTFIDKDYTKLPQHDLASHIDSQLK